MKQLDMSTRTVTNQEEFDRAIKDQINQIVIRSEAGVWIVVRACGSSTVTVCGSSTVTVCGSSTVTAYESSTVTAYDSSTVTACGSSSVTAYGSSTVRAYGSSTVVTCDSSTARAYGSCTVNAYNSSTVNAYYSSTVTACDSSTVRAYDSSTVTAYDSSTVRACGSSTVRAYDSSTVTAYDSSTVNAYDSSTVNATPLVAVHLHSAKVHTKGGVILDHTHVNDMDGPAWCEYHGVKVKRGIATLYKAVNDKWTTYRGTDYSPGTKPSCDDWNEQPVCGGGLHFGPTPVHALAYHDGATKFVAVGVRVADLVPITKAVVVDVRGTVLAPIPDGTAKAKAPRVVRACVECDINGKVRP